MRTTLSVIGFVVVALIVGTCVACVEDDSENALRGPYMAATAVFGGDREDNRKNGSDDCRDARGPCEDNDASPSFTDSPVEDSFNPVVCLPGATCHSH